MLKQRRKYIPLRKMASDFRIEELNKFKQSLEQEIQKRKILSNKYQRYEKALSAMNYVLMVVDFALGTTGVALISSGILVIPGIIFSGLGSGLSIFSIIFSAVAKKLRTKAEKHKNIENLANSKLNIMFSLYSKALDDNLITDDEFSDIQGVLQKYSEAKQQIQSQYASAGEMDELVAQLKQKKN